MIFETFYSFWILIYQFIEGVLFCLIDSSTAF